MDSKATYNDMSATQHHYLKRELLKLQIESEVLRFNDSTSLRTFGTPFTSQDPQNYKQEDPNDPPADLYSINQEFPLTKFAFTRFLLTFPFFSQAHQDWDELWIRRVQVLYEKFMSMDMSSTVDREEATKRRKIGKKIKSLLLIMFNSGIGTPTDTSYYQHDQAEIGVKVTSDKLKDILFPTKESLKSHLSEDQFVNGIKLNVPGVRLMKKTNNIFLSSLSLKSRTESYYEFIVSTKLNFPDCEDVYVGRRYSDFKHLHSQLKKKFTGKHLPSLPAKSKIDLSVESSSSSAQDSTDADSQCDDALDQVKQNVTTLLSEMKIEESITAMNSNSSHGTRLKVNYFEKKKKLVKIQQRAQSASLSLPRENARVALRAYLRALLEDPEIAQSEIMKEFLNKEKIMALTNENIIDMRAREDVDLLKLMNQVQFQKEAYKKIVELKLSSMPLRAKLLESDNGILEVFSELKTKKNIDELSAPLRNFITWCEVEVAATIYQMFLANDNSAELFSQVKRLHKLIPYSLMYQILKYTNPMLIMKSMIELLMANPFGGKSLLQTIFYSVLSDDIKTQEHEIAELESKIEDKDLLGRMKFTVFQNRDPSLLSKLKTESNRSGDDYLLVLLTTSQLYQFGPLEPHTEKALLSSYEEYKRLEALKDHSEEGLFLNQDRLELYSTLKQLLKLYTKSHDKAILQQLWLEPDLTSLLKEIFTMFYQPLVVLFRNSHVEVAFKHFEKFMDDLIDVVTSLQDSLLDRDTSEVIDEIMGVLKRHEGNFYRFLNEVYVNDKGNVFDGIIEWINGLLKFLRTGRSADGPAAGDDFKIDLNSIFKRYPHLNREGIMREVDNIILQAKKAREVIDENLKAPEASEGILDQTWKQINGQAEIFTASDFGVNVQDLYEDDEAGSETKSNEDETDFSDAANNVTDKASLNVAIRTMMEPFKEQLLHVLSLYK
ncbi:hypothetical protein WICPIJ_009193 [Wickerhamomyces pijperi]|uniref:PX domain-containing protein n=1 Tax=Wickerhamomyces pijperi TaxID=599730 RepID=A0A9P8TE63_WICPI|nr:hypothetical protein WICPIJ_009193 [Wickerhamomyces pijperi]